MTDSPRFHILGVPPTFHIELIFPSTYNLYLEKQWGNIYCVYYALNILHMLNDLLPANPVTVVCILQIEKIRIAQKSGCWVIQ